MARKGDIGRTPEYRRLADAVMDAELALLELIPEDRPGRAELLMEIGRCLEMIRLAGPDRRKRLSRIARSVRNIRKSATIISSGRASPRLRRQRKRAE